MREAVILKVGLASTTVAVVLVFSGCKSPSALTAEAIGCRVTGIEIVDSEFKREGSTTAWCARCEDVTYQCATNPERNRVECREVADGAAPCR
ncbi:MAG: hypothetical protein WDZ63_05405 [Burkholderiales bacterium]